MQGIAKNIENKTCALEECGVVFRPKTKRQKYHLPRCANRAEFLNKEKKKNELKK